VLENTGSWVADWARETLGGAGWTVDSAGEGIVVRRGDVVATLPLDGVEELAVCDERVNLLFAVRSLARPEARLVS